MEKYKLDAIIFMKDAWHLRKKTLPFEYKQV